MKKVRSRLYAVSSEESREYAKKGRVQNLLSPSFLQLFSLNSAYFLLFSAYSLLLLILLLQCCLLLLMLLIAYKIYLAFGSCRRASYLSHRIFQ